MFYEITQVANRNMVGLAELCDQAVFGLLKSQSAAVTDFKSPDLGRLYERLDELNSYADWVARKGGNDTPETHPFEWPIRYIASGLSDDTENKAIRDIVRDLRTLQNELLRSQSAKLASGWHGPDKERRFDPIMDAIRSYLDDYVSNAIPRDVPEGTPVRDSIGHGHNG